MENENSILTNKKLLHIVNFKTLEKWYVSYYTNPFSIRSKYELLPLKNIIQPSQERIKKKEYDGTLPVVKKISFNDGKIHLRDLNETAMDLYIIRKGELLISKINFHQGAIAYNDLADLVCTTHYQPYKINSTYVIPDYLVTVLRSPPFQNYVSELRAEGIKNEATYNFIGNIVIPVPSLFDQKKVMMDYHNRMKNAEEQYKKAKEIDSGIEQFILKELYINKQEKKAIKKVLNIVQYNLIKEWGAEIILGVSSKLIFLSKKFSNIQLQEVVYVNPKTDLTQLKDDDEMSFIPMEDLSDEYGEIIKLKEGKKRQSTGYKKFQDRDLLWARITPCMENGKSAIVNDLKNRRGFGSTEFHVLRKKSNNILLDYVYHLLRTKLVRNDAKHYFTGSAGQQRVPKSYLENLSIPLPPLTVQKNMSEKIYEMKEKIKLLTKSAQENHQLAIKKFEEEIFS
jgi:type I restriction enzyme S subunit